MKPRERVALALNHQEPARCPMQVSFTPEFAERLRADLDIKGTKIHNPHGGGLILGPTHHVRLDTPMENFWAMVQTITQTQYETIH